MPHRKIQAAADKIGLILSGASPSPWEVRKDAEVISADGHIIRPTHPNSNSAQWRMDSEYVAFWQPDVALAVYRLLDAQAELHMQPDKCNFCNPESNPLNTPCRALALAEEILQIEV